MTMRFTVVCLLLPLLLAIQSEAALRRKFKPRTGSYCQAPKGDASGKEAVPADFHTVCRSNSEAERDKLAQVYDVLPKHLEKLISETIPVIESLKSLLEVLGWQLIDGSFATSDDSIDEMRKQVIVSAIEGGRIAEAVTLFVVSRSWNNSRFIVDSMSQNQRHHQRHVEYMLSFISLLPSRQEKIEFYHQLRAAMVRRKEHESYLGGMFANNARRVVFDKDGKTVLNQTDERELWTTMVAASAGHFKRIILGGKNVMDLYFIDRDHHSLLDMLLPKIFDVSKEDLRHLDFLKMVEVPCKACKAHTKVLLFREIMLLLQKHFTWENQNFLHAPRLAHRFKRCMPFFGYGVMSTKLKAETMELWKKFHNGETYETLVATMEKRIANLAG